MGEPVYDPEILGTGAGIGLRKDDAELKQKFNDALAAIIASGEYKTINDKYISVEHPAEVGRRARGAGGGMQNLIALLSAAAAGAAA